MAKQQIKKQWNRLRRLGAVPALAGFAAAVLAAALIEDAAVALAVVAAVLVLELGFVTVLLTRLLRGLREAAVMPRAAVPVREADPRGGLEPLPKRKLRPLRRWTSRLENGFAASALPTMYKVADSRSELPVYKLAMLEAVVSWRERRRNTRSEGARLRLDVVLVSNLNLLGGTNASNVEEVKAYRRAGLTVGLLHHPVYEWNVGREINPRVIDLLDDEGVVMLTPRHEVECELMIVRFPPALMRPLDERPDITPARTVLLINQTPFESYGPTGGRHFSWDVATVQRNLTEWVGESTWYTIGPSVREALERYHREELEGVDIADEHWFGSLDPDVWRREGRRESDGVIRIGRHSRDHMLKWQTIAEDLRACYPDADDIEIHVLGGAEAPRRVLGRLPDNWTEYPFGSMPAPEFLHTLDVAVYFTAEEYVEAFGRSPMEAMAAGLPCVMPPRFEPLFGDGGLYCEPEEVESTVRRLMEDPEFYRRQSERSLAAVREHFSHEALLRRVAKLGVRGPGVPIPAGSVAESGERRG
ncbi:glycosyltransferase [Glycomyces tenuis]|uniref:glycosyltransferase n=1 Tax=Glycomyces tenuis TaxID=58116 RepID=UPI000401E662|nr:glycosyltransferase [Glycomyces tenuis]